MKWFNKRKILTLFMILCPMLILGCSALQEVFKCSTEDERIMRSAAATKMANGVTVPGKGIYLPGGEFIDFNDRRIGGYGLVRNEINKSATRWIVKIGSSIPRALLNFASQEGMSGEQLDLTNVGYRKHRWEILMYYWCVNRQIADACRDQYGIPEEHLAQIISKNNDIGNLEPWEPNIDQYYRDKAGFAAYKAIQLE